MLDLLHTFARDYPIMAAVLVVVMVAGLITMALDWRASRVTR
jgi:hypothetical protein